MKVELVHFIGFFVKKHRDSDRIFLYNMLSANPFLYITYLFIKKIKAICDFNQLVTTNRNIRLLENLSTLNFTNSLTRPHSCILYSAVRVFLLMGY